MDSTLPHRKPDADRAVAFYAWRDLLRRAPGLPQQALIEAARLTEAQVPHLGDVVAETEYHIERVIGLVREAVNRDRVAHGLPPVLYHVATDTLVTHLFRETAAGPELTCESPVPGLICDCGRYVIEQVAPQQIP